MIAYFWYRAEPVAWTTMRTMKEAENFQEAVTILSETYNLASSYLIVSGVNEDEGMIIEKDRYKVIKTRSLDTKNGIWFLV